VTTLSLSSAIKGGANLAKSGASAMASSVGLNADPMGYEVDTLLRNDGSVAVGKSATVGNSATVETSRGEVLARFGDRRSPWFSE
jgi:hypothetical protein